MFIQYVYTVVYTVVVCKHYLLFFERLLILNYLFSKTKILNALKTVAYVYIEISLFTGAD
ncbi:hypothetical protein CSC79_18195 [Pseudoalteromonas sp. 3D05]|nr:hypothetical protein CSC79_18195 [Pseudoalteromonas sp. 3D05]